MIEIETWKIIVFYFVGHFVGCGVGILTGWFKWGKWLHHNKVNGPIPKVPSLVLNEKTHELYNYNA